MILNKDPPKESMRPVFLFTTIGPGQCFVRRFAGAKKKIVKLHGGKNKKKEKKKPKSHNLSKHNLTCPVMFPIGCLVLSSRPGENGVIPPECSNLSKKTEKKIPTVKLVVV